jgi:uncharacterized membrane protein HdeD (DUF308 family)
MENKIKQYRTTLLINGIIALLFGSLSLLLPVPTIKTIVKYFGILLLLGGGTGIYFSIQHMKNDKPYLTSLVTSIISVVMGVVLFFNTRQSLIIFATIIGIWALVIGAVQLFIALKLLQKGNYRKALIINSVITLIFGLLLFLNPFGSVIALVYIVGAIALIIGVILIFFSFSLKSTE